MTEFLTLDRRHATLTRAKKKARGHILTSTIKNIVHTLPLRCWSLGPRGSSLLGFYDREFISRQTVSRDFVTVVAGAALMQL